MDFLLSKNDEDITYLESFQNRLDMHGNGTNGDEMPPTPWDDNKKYGKTYKIKTKQIQDKRRQNLGVYLTMLAGTKDTKHLIQYCRSVSSDTNVKNVKKKKPKTKGAKAVEL